MLAPPMKSHLLWLVVALCSCSVQAASPAVTAAQQRLQSLEPAAASLAVEDMAKKWPDRPEIAGQRSAVQAYAMRRDALLAALAKGDEAAATEAQRLSDDVQGALLANPLLKFDRLLLVKRGRKQLGLSQNWESNSSLPKTGYDNELVTLSPVRPSGTLTTFHKPDGGRFVGDVDLDFDASRLLVSSIGKNGRWQVLELKADGSVARELPLIGDNDVDNYDACWLPDGSVLFCSTAPFTGVPCVQGSAHVCNLFHYDPANGQIRRLTFEQDHDWCPTPMEDGRVLYQRWEYSDLPHFVSRILFTMNPDGTGQRALYGSNSYWPNAMFYARPIPGDRSRFVAIVGGHHDVPRMGELVLFDTGRGRAENAGVVQRIPGRGKPVEPKIRDDLVKASWPKFLHPWPLDGDYFLVAAQPTAQSEWGLYLADTFDNLTLIKEVPGYALFEPVPFVARTRPPVLAKAVKPESKDAQVYIADLYAGPGLAGVPRGAVKSLRLFTYQFAYHGMGGQVNRVGLDGPWDVKRIIGTVPVKEDGSAFFRVPANTPISVQPLDADGAALQLMRSWMTAMPGEKLSCIGCHESQNTVPPARPTLASEAAPDAITPWYGPTRGFSFRREVQPVLDRLCVSCHGGETAPDLRDGPDVQPQALSAQYNNGTKFPPSYVALRSYVRTPTIESDMHLLMPGEYHAGTTALIQLLKRGHRGVQLSREDWDRLYTWIDLNTPAHGTWREIVGDAKVMNQRDRRLAMMQKYGGETDDPEAIPATKPVSPAPKPIEPVVEKKPLACDGWPFDAAEAARRQQALGTAAQRIELAPGVVLDLVKIPAGSFVGAQSVETIAKPFWIARCEVPNALYALFDPAHDSRLESGDFLQFSERERGYPANEPQQPVVRISARRAAEFCAWLSAKTGRSFGLPTGPEWEWAARAGAESAFWFGDVQADFSRFANLADRSLRTVDTFGWSLPSGAIPPWRPADVRVSDGFRVAAPVGKFAPSPWGLYDVAGNVAEWTQPVDGMAAARGGSWSDRPLDAPVWSSTRYPDWQSVYNVGFRVVLRE